MKRVLVTGGAGFIGSHLCEALLKKGHEVVCFDNFFRGKQENVEHLIGRKDFTLIKGDIRNGAEVEKVVQDCDIVHHLAAINGTKYFYEEPILITDVNVAGTLNVLKACADTDVRRITFASSPEVYGLPEKIPTPEDAFSIFDNPTKTLRHSYSTSKYLGDVLCLAFHEKYGLPVTVLRYFNIYGPKLIGTEYGQVVSIFIKKALEGKPIEIFGDGKQTRSFTYVSDAVDATIRAQEKEKAIGQALNVGIQKETTIKELANRVLKITKSNSKIVHKPALVGDAKRRCPDTKKAKKILGWGAKTNLDEGLKKTIEWFKAE
ncbi:TPA: SDR family NAD(P)-dependent oxidoreductase [archaeon]|uniref:SDR family NAD(P)-dependent oxidoreductase n=1 Tax=Candidatus Naiadarchaeum limnaeum TaxID=2756139 RepID=A0A832XGX7_9ARCH|nr:SDR family NAD(P)-dependent oxidoreductase [Candidatus Naiadarchaeum limnaeum]